MIDYFSKLADPTVAAGAISSLMVLCGYIMLSKLKKDSPFAPYALQILGLTFILPVVLLSAILLKIESQAMVGLLGTIIGYIFGTSKVQDRKRNGSRQPNKNTDGEGRGTA